MAAVAFKDQPRAITLSGELIPGASLWFTTSGTDDPTPVYADHELRTKLQNPLPSNGAAQFAPFWRDPEVVYRARLLDLDGSVLWDRDPLDPLLLPFTFPVIPLDFSGAPMPLARLSFFDAETTQQQTVYSDAGLSVPIDQPIIADPDGEFVTVYLDTELERRVLLQRHDLTLFYDIDNVFVPGFSLPTAPVLSGERDESDDTQVDLSWTAAVAGTYAIDEYVLERSLNGAAFAELAVISASDPRVYTDTGLLATDEIEYRVFARDVEANDGPDSNVVTIDIAPDAYQPINLDFGTQIVARGAPASFDRMIREIGNVLRDPGDTGREYKLVYTGYPADPPTNNTAIGYAYSSDGVTWTKAGQLTLGRAAEDPYVVKSGSTYYLYVEDKEDLPFRNIRLYTSTNFSSWTDQGDVLDIGTGWEATDVSSPTVWIEGATWYMLYEGRGTDQAGAIGLATSSDGITWTKNGGNPVLVGQNPTYGYTGPIAWSDGIVPDDIVKTDGTYVLQLHGRKDSTEVFYFRAGIATSTDLLTWTDALGTQLFTISAPDPTVMVTPIDGALPFLFAFPGAGIVAAEEGSGDANWASTVLYVTGYEYDATTRFYDLSASWHTISTVGNTQVDDAQSKYGPSSILFDGSGDRLTIPDHADWNFGSGAFTVEAWVRFAATETAANVICSQWATASRAWSFDYFNNALRFSYSTNGTTTAATLTFAWTQSGGTWFHFALTRDGSGNVRAFVDGVQVGTTQAVAVTIFNSTAQLWIGAIETATPGNDFNGHMQLLRITKGVARYTSNFTPPTEAFPVGEEP